MIDELEERRQRRRETRAGMVRWVKSLREKILTETRAALAAESMMGAPPGAIERVLNTCADEDIVDMLAFLAGSHLHGELVQHMRSVQFVETEAERVAREASPPRAAYVKLSPVASAWLWGALSSVRDRARREGSEVVAVVDALLDALRSGAKTS